MKVDVAGGAQLPKSLALLVVPVHDAKGKPRVDGPWGSILDAAERAMLGHGDVSGAEGKALLLPGTREGRPRRVLFLGLGPAADVDAETLRRWGGRAASRARELTGRRAVALLPASGANLTRPQRVAAVVEGLALGAYDFHRYRGGAEAPEPQRIARLTVLAEDRRGSAGVSRAAEEALAVAHGVVLCRDLGNTPGNDLGPVELAAVARREGRASGLRVQVLDERACARHGMGALLSVARGSARPPRLIVLEYQPPGAGRGGAKQAGKGAARGSRRRRPLVCVGKAITFDSGGISLKRPEGMQDMKFDMCGGAAVLGALAAVGRLRLPRPVVGIIAAAENMPGSAATRPGDIVRSASGLTVEIINTDAEGRLVLADALHHAKRFDPELVVDVATLTGACVVALGHANSGVFSVDEALSARVREAGRRAGERLWPLPVEEDYGELMKSDVADLKNSGGRWGGACAAAAFLARFIEGHSWVHLDIAGTAWTDREGPYQGKGATGVAVRTLVELARTP